MELWDEYGVFEEGFSVGGIIILLSISMSLIIDLYADLAKQSFLFKISFEKL